MYQARMTLISEVEKALSLWKRGIWLRGLALVGLVAGAGLCLMVLLRHFWVDLPWLIPAFFMLTAIGIAFAVYAYLVLPLRQKADVQLAARAIETRNPQLEDRLVTAIEQASRIDAASRRWLQRILLDIRDHSQGIDLKQQLKVKGHVAWQSLFLFSVVLLAALLMTNSAWIGDFKTMVDAGFVPPQPPLELTVSPGSAHIKKGSALQVSASFRNYSPDEATIFYTTDDTSWQSTLLEIDASNGTFDYDFYDVQKSFQYYVKIGSELSDIYDVTVFESPKIKRIDLTYNYPKYTGLAARFERNGGDIWAPFGTTVKVSVLTERPVVSGQIQIGEDAVAADMQMLSDTTAVGYIKVQEETFYNVRLVNREKLDNSPFSDYYIHAVQDNPPTITLKKPSRDMKATMLEEVPVIAEIGNDFGLEYVRMAITVNSEPEIFADMQPLSANSEQEANGFSFQFRDFQGLLYLEDLGVEIGDFITYYVAVKDRSQKDEIKSDIYFVDIRNFENIYNVAESQGNGGGGQMGGGGLELSLSQREIITATTRLQRDQEKLSEADLAERRDKIKNAQSEVRKTTEQIANMSRMQMGMGDASSKRTSAEFEAAAKYMQDAENHLDKEAIDDALKSERDAYTHLVRAEMAVNERQLQNSQTSNGGGGARMQNSDELSRLFQEELDKLKNKYETLQQGDKSQTQQATNEAMQKLKELARRQQAINEQSRQLANRNLSEEEKKRELKKLQRQQEQLQRDTQQAMQQQSLNRDVMNELQRAAEEMQRASSNMRQQQSNSALSSGQQAQDRLENIEDRLRKSQQNALRDGVEKMQNQLQQLADQQKRLADSSAARLSQQGDAAEQQNLERQQAQQQRLSEQLESSLREMERMSQDQKDHPDVQRGLSELSRDLQQDGVQDKMEQAGRAMEQGRHEQAERLQRSAQAALDKSAKDLQQIARGLQGSKDEKLESALQDAQQLRRNLEDRLQHAQTEAQQQQNSDNPQAGEQQQGGQIGNPQSGSQRLTQDMLDQWKDEIWRTREQLESLQQQFRKDSLAFDERGQRNELDRATGQAIEDLSGFVRTFVDADPQRISEVVQKLIDPLRRIEAELQSQIQLGKSEESLRTVRDQPIPSEYKEMVEEYYRSLSKARE